MDLVGDPPLQVPDVRALGRGRAEGVAELGLSTGATKEEEQGTRSSLGDSRPEILFDEDEDEDEDDIGNRVSSSSGAFDDSAGNRRDGGVARAVLEYVAAALVEDPTGISVVPEARRGSVTFHLHVAPEDMGRVIGRRGRVAQALRTVVRVAGARDGVDAGVDIVD